MGPLSTQLRHSERPLAARLLDPERLGLAESGMTASREARLEADAFDRRVVVSQLQAEHSESVTLLG